MKNIRRSNAYKVFRLVKENKIRYYGDLLDFLTDHKKIALFDWATSEKGYVFCSVILIQPYETATKDELEQVHEQYDDLHDFVNEDGSDKCLFANEEVKLDICMKISKLIRENDFQFYADLIEFLDENGMDEELYFAFNSIIFCTACCVGRVRKKLIEIHGQRRF